MTDTPDREIVVTRLIDAPRDLVFSAFTEREHAEKWWVPDGTTHEWNGEPGGYWRYSRPGSDGGHFAFKVQFIEVDRPARFVYDFGSDAEDAPEPVRTTVTFEEQDGKTRVTSQLLFPATAVREEAGKLAAARREKIFLRDLHKYIAVELMRD